MNLSIFIKLKVKKGKKIN